MTALSTFTPSLSADALPQRWVARIFDRLTAQMGAKVADLYAGVPSDNVQAEWAQALAGFDPSEIDRGIRACQTRPFAPTLGEFTRLCRPALDAELAFIEAQHGLRQRDAGEPGEWSHPAVYRAACAMSLEVRRGDFREVRRRWEFALTRELAKGWGEIPAPALRLGSQVTVRGPNEAERERLGELMAKAKTAALLKPSLEEADGQ